MNVCERILASIFDFRTLFWNYVSHLNPIMWSNSDDYLIAVKKYKSIYLFTLYQRTKNWTYKIYLHKKYNFQLSSSSNSVSLLCLVNILILRLSALGGSLTKSSMTNLIASSVTMHQKVQKFCTVWQIIQKPRGSRKFRRHTEKLGGTSSPYLPTSRDLAATINVILQVFNGENVNTHVNRCWNVLCDKYNTVQLRSLSFIQFCCWHVTHAIARSLN